MCGKLLWGVQLSASGKRKLHLFLPSWLLWHCPTLSSGMRSQLRLCSRQDVPESKVPGPMPRSLWYQCSLSCDQAPPYLYVSSKLSRRPISRLPEDPTQDRTSLTTEGSLRSKSLRTQFCVQAVRRTPNVLLYQWKHRSSS